MKRLVNEERKMVKSNKINGRETDKKKKKMDDVLGKKKKKEMRDKEM